MFAVESSPAVLGIYKFHVPATIVRCLTLWTELLVTKREAPGQYGVASFGLAAGGMGKVFQVRLNAYIRQQSPERPLSVVNDFVASSLGRAIGLPVPPGTLHKLSGDQWAYVSLSFDDRGDRPPPVLPQKFCEERPWEATGVVAFDHWIYNTDRHDENLAYGADIGVAVFDHDLALFGDAAEADAERRLQDCQDAECKGHLLAKYLKTDEHFDFWKNRIKAVGAREISHIVGQCCNAKMIQKKLGRRLEDFIKFRQAKIQAFVDRCENDFPSLARRTLQYDGGGE